MMQPASHLKSNVKVRPATKADDAVVINMLHELQMHECTLTPQRRQWTAADAAAYWALMQQKLQAQKGICVVAEQDGVVVGISLGWVEHEPLTFKMTADDITYGVQADGYVLPSLRRAGVYSMLVMALEAHFKSLGVKRVRRATFANNSSLLAAANAQGYQLYEITLEKAL